MQPVTKERLIKYVDMLEELENQRERLLRLEHSVSSPHSPGFDGLPRAGGDPDKIGIALSQKEMIEESIRETELTVKKEFKELEKAVRRLKKAEERMVIRLRYFDRYSWQDVAAAMFHKQKDYVDKEESYIRRVQRIHGNALLSLKNT